METNPPGQPYISYRAGTWATFNESMLARLSSSDYPALSGLTTRNNDDFTIAFLDATSIVLDILTFYQERLANESYLRTAVQQQSVTELSRLIGYQPSPGVSASTFLAFTLKAAPGLPPNPSNPAITIPQGTQVQSVPAQGQTPQTFETFADIQAKSDWNALPVQTGNPWVVSGATEVYLSGTATKLKLGDSLLILGVNRETWTPAIGSPSEEWDVVVLNQVVVDNVRQLTYVAWDQPLSHESGSGTSGYSSNAAKVFAFRQKTGLFGHNAPNPNLFVNPNSSSPNYATTLPLLIDTTPVPWQWNNYQIASSSQIDLDATYSGIVADSWFALTSAAPQVFVLGYGNSLWLEPTPLGGLSQGARILVDVNVLAFQALSPTQVFVLDGKNNLWLDEAPFSGQANQNSPILFGVSSFQGLSANDVFYTDTSTPTTLCFTAAPFPGIVDSSVKSFQAVSANQVFVLDPSGNLSLDTGPFGSAPALQKPIGKNITAFQAVSANEVFVLDINGNLWLDQAPFGPGQPAPIPIYQPKEGQVGAVAFQALSSTLIFVAVGAPGAGALLVIEGPSGAGRVQTKVDTDFLKLVQAFSSSEVLVVDSNGNSCLDYGPWETPPPGGDPKPTRAQFDALMPSGGGAAQPPSGGAAQAVPSNVAQLFNVQRATTVSLANFGLSGKVTELAGDYSDPNISTTFQLQPTQVWAQSDELTIAEQPLDHPLYGSFLDLHDLRPDLAAVTVVAISGNSQKIAVADRVTNLQFTSTDGTSVTLNPGDILTLTDPSPLPLNTDGSVPDWSTATSPSTLNVTDPSGRPGTVQVQPGATTPLSLSNFTLVPSGASDPVVSEYVLVTPGGVATVTTYINPANPAGPPLPTYPHTRIALQTNLTNCYDRTTTTVNANVGQATQGRSVTEIMGNGNAATPDQTFMLKQSPLTFIQAATTSGGQSTLQVQANGVTWTEVPSLYAQGPSQQVFATLNEPGGATEVLFGDGVEGATLPTGQNNIQANYRIGLGSAGNVGAGALTTLIDRPIGVSGVTNPEGATGGQDPDSIDDIRSNAPQTVLTLGRAVSITDYQNFAATYAGISKAYALWIPNGPCRGVFLTVAGVDGAALPPGNLTLANLQTALQNYGNPLIPIKIVSFVETLFGLTADLQYAPNITTSAAQQAVNTQVRQALYGTFSFAQRNFGQGVSADEVATVIQGVPGVVAVNVTGISPGPSSLAGDLANMGLFTLSGYYNWQLKPVTLPRPCSGSPTRICAYLPLANSLSAPYPAEILVLNPDPTQVTLSVMS
jgi:predicted phage baseplate assembly protein